MQHLEVSGAVRPLKWSLGVKWLRISGAVSPPFLSCLFYTSTNPPYVMHTTQHSAVLLT